MKLFDQFRGIVAGQQISSEYLAGYKRLGEQVFEVEVELARAESAPARALLRAAKSLQVMGDALLRDVYADNKMAYHVPAITRDQAEAWYGRIPELLVAARQEACFAGAGKVQLPVRFGMKYDMQGMCPIEHLAGMRRAADEMENLIKDGVTDARSQGETYRSAILLFEEARTRRASGDAIVGSILDGRRLPPASHEDAEKHYWVALEDYLLIAQALEIPALADKKPAATVKKSRLDSDDVFKVTSPAALEEIRRRPGEYAQARRDFAELWAGHRVSDAEREYENTVDALAASGGIKEDGYWYCCPFPPVYKVMRGPVEVAGHTVAEGHVFVWNYREGRLVTQAGFRAADSRHYCADDSRYDAGSRGSGHHCC